MANYFETITKFLPKAVDKYFEQEAKSLILENGSKYIDVNFDEAGYVKIADVLLDGLSNYYRTQEQPQTNDLAGYSSTNPGDGYAAYSGNLGSGIRDGFDIGGTSIRWEIFKLQWCRGRQFRIDHISNEETAKVITGALVEEFHRLKVVPEVDACRFGVIADSASVSLGNLVTETAGTDITESNILSKFFNMRKWLVEHGVPLEELVWFMSPDVYTILVNSDKLTKFITQEDYRSDKGLTIEIKKFNDIPIVEVPSSRFFTQVQVGRNGFYPGSGSKCINYMMCSRKAVIPVRKIEYTKMYDEEMSGLAGFYGVLFNYLLYHGVVIPKNKMVGTYVSVGTSGSTAGKANVLQLDIEETSSRYWKVKNFFTLPAGMRGTLLVSPADFTLGATPTVTGPASTTAITGTNVVSFNLDETIDYGSTALADVSYYFALIDFAGRVIAKSGAVKVIDV